MSNSSDDNNNSKSPESMETLGVIGPFTIKGTVEVNKPLDPGGLEVVALAAQQVTDLLPSDAKVQGCIVIVVLDDPSGDPRTAMGINSWSAAGAFGLTTGLVAAMDQLEHPMPSNVGEDVDDDDSTLGWC